MDQVPRKGLDRRILQPVWLGGTAFMRPGQPVGLHIPVPRDVLSDQPLDAALVAYPIDHWRR